MELGQLGATAVWTIAQKTRANYPERASDSPLTSFPGV